MDDYNNMNNPYGSPEPPAQPDYASQYNQDQYSQQPDYANQYNQHRLPIIPLSMISTIRQTMLTASSPIRLSPQADLIRLPIPAKRFRVPQKYSASFLWYAVSFL